ncbi:hypothetical protein JCGZ_23624 [Jatropha curcas]|uniref:Myb-like domain-containing protein n=1 Tax=Jatropha curcas TaxID=180498 RepID=A0A067LF24_JATCU|nr:hypothetical protein JCGZ_23624 [Jatropha curcas]
MEMEDHTHHNQYTVDLRQFISGGPTHHFPSIPQPHPPPTELYRNLQPQTHHYDMMMLLPRGGGGGGGLHDFHSESTAAAGPPCMAVAAPPPSGGGATGSSGNTTVATAAATPTLSGLEAEAASFGGCDGGTGRWPRQETLTLLEIRSRLDSKFKEANQKGPLWDEVSRIMCEEHGYQRSGKKCREKFENLYKYYKKTKEGKAGRQDGKHYRFFRQLEALYGETSNSASIPETHFVNNNTNLPFHTTCTTQSNNQETNFHSQNKLCDSLSLSNSSEFDTCSSDEDNNLSTATLMENDSIEKRRKRRDGKSWKAKIKEFIDSQMRKLIHRQEAWLEKLTQTLEQKEQERIAREEEWRQQEAARIDREHKFWAKERAWIEARDAALMDTLRKLTGKEIQNQSEKCQSGNEKCGNWTDEEVTRLMQLKSSIESRFAQNEEEEEEEKENEEEEALWEEIAAKMVCMGYHRSAIMCKEKWESSISNYSRKVAKKRKENNNSRNGCYYPRNDQSMYNAGASGYIDQINEQENQETANSNAAVVNDSCFSRKKRIHEDDYDVETRNLTC